MFLRYVLPDPEYFDIDSMLDELGGIFFKGYLPLPLNYRNTRINKLNPYKGDKNMVALPRAIDVEAEKGQGGTDICITEGEYPMIILSSEAKETKTGGLMVILKMIITSGDLKDTEFNQNFNIVHSNPEVVRISSRQLANIGHAVGLPTLTNTNQLHNRPFIGEVVNKKKDDWVNNDGQTVTGKIVSEVKKYHPLPQAGGGHTGFTPPAAQTVFQAPAQEQQPAAQAEAQAQATPAPTDGGLVVPDKNPFAA